MLFINLHPGSDARFIPAYTGNAPGTSLSNSKTTVYPRVYGECAPQKTDVT